MHTLMRAHRGGALLVVAADLLALTLLRPPGAFGADAAVLDGVWRHGARLREVVTGVTAEIRGPQRRHRAAGGTEHAGSAEVHLLRSTAQEAADVAHLLRSAHLHDHLPWHRMAVLVRSVSTLAFWATTSTTAPLSGAMRMFRGAASPRFSWVRRPETVWYPLRSTVTV